MSNLTLRYIPSAFESAGSFLAVHNYYPDLAEDMLMSIKNQEPGIDVGVLWNAYSEKKDGIGFHKVLRPLGVKQYSDSGGLQVISRGAVITPEIKKEIFDTQMKYSDYAMSFDEIPITFREGGPDSGSYVDEWFQKKAIESGKNIVDQIRIFKEGNTDTKILFIVQGKDFETCREWSWFMYEVIKQEPDYEKYIGGLALGKTTAMGARNITDFTMRFQEELEFLPLSWRKKLHILGAGAVSRLLAPIFVKDDFFLEGTIITADSTSQTRASVFGNHIFFNGNKLESVSTGRDVSKESLLMCQHQSDYVLPFIEKHREKYNLKPVDATSYREHYTEYADHGMRKLEQFKEIYEGDELKYEHYKHTRMARFFWTMTMISSFIKYIESLKIKANEYRNNIKENRSNQKITKSLSNAMIRNMHKPATLLMEINTYEDYVPANERLQGHPYKTVLPLELSGDVKDSILVYKNTKYITDFYDGQLLGRELQATSVGGAVHVNTKRDNIMSLLAGVQLDTQKTEKLQKVELDEW